MVFIEERISSRDLILLVVDTGSSSSKRYYKKWGTLNQFESHPSLTTYTSPCCSKNSKILAMVALAQAVGHHDYDDK
jgi:hypothetical protein